MSTALVPPAPPTATAVFGDRLPLAEAYAGLLCGDAEIAGEGQARPGARRRAAERRGRSEGVRARAVADPVRLAGWSRGLLRVGGELQVLCGETVAQDAVAVRGELTKRGWRSVSITSVALDGISASPVLRATRP